MPESWAMTILPPLSLYVHIPWCEKKCPYCDFNSHAVKGVIPESDYVSALIKDLTQELCRVRGRRLESVFIGGGTPSLFSGETISDLLAGIRLLLPTSDKMEITLEANPGSAETEKFIEFRQAGVNRLSIGVQSFQDGYLKKLGRIHTGQDAQDAASAARAAGFERFNLDLMYGLPGQDPADSLEDITFATGMGPPHLSCYQLTIEPNTRFHNRPPKLPSEDQNWVMQSGLQALLRQSGYKQYEISAYAEPGQECRHNLNYWEFGDYLGIGAGAHGKITVPDGGIIRYWKQRHPASYLASAGSEKRIGDLTPVSQGELPLEFMMNALRLRQGFSKALFEERTGLPFSGILDIVTRHCDKGLMTIENGIVRPTDLGFRFLNTMLEDYL
jgi:oxygen-independent coproporphyrinogen-3 oxidase